MFAIDILPKAERQLKKLAKREREVYRDIEAAIDALANWLRVSNVKKLAHHAYGYRMRVGAYRILFDVHTSVRVIAVQEVKKRDEHTY